ncbi:hypothetical protein [Leptolyngbya sp. 7M]|uniref:hypothetical protein n=1 Tax=Leptolyngbya sp. 7M TaxID=2812896 RepID=UPI0021F1F0EF|nr:hypothetical protein [Leptolyngbya sp. 7M]
MFRSSAANREGEYFNALLSQGGNFPLDKGVGGSGIFTRQIGNPHTIFLIKTG